MDSIYEKIPFEDTGFPIRINFDYRLSPTVRSSPALSWHEQMELLYFKKGGAEVYFGSDKYSAQDGDLIIINPYEIHAVTYAYGEPEYDCIMIDPSLYCDVQQGACETKYFDYLSEKQICFENVIGGNSEASVYIKNIVSEFLTKDFAYELAVKHQIFGLFVCLFRNHIKNGASIKELIQNTKRYDRLKAAFEYMHANLSDNIPFAALAGICNVSQAHFCRLFKNITGKTPVQYLTSIRLHEAEALLKSSDKSVSQIACEVGIPDLCYFSRKFKEMFGFTPSQVKNSLHISHDI